MGRVGSTTDFITQKVEYAREYDERNLLMSILPSCDGLTLIFMEVRVVISHFVCLFDDILTVCQSILRQTKRGADSLEGFLIEQGVNATCIHGDRSQQE